jgi:protoheme IX farnesyltransferase
LEDKSGLFDPCGEADELFMNCLRSITLALKAIRTRYWPLIKSLQTLLLLTTGVAGYMSVRPINLAPGSILAMAGSLFLAISGSTVLNMWYDRDIDAIMQRTCTRPLAAQSIPPHQALLLGLVLSMGGIGWAITLSPIYGSVVFAGLFIDVFIYTLWLKRRTAWSIILGGISGGLPVLAGRTIAMGRIDWVGIILMLAILFWIPTHILTFNMRYYDDYLAAHVPTITSTYGFQCTRIIIAISSVLAALAMGLAAFMVGSSAGVLSLLVVLGTGLLILALTSVAHPSTKLNFGLFKYASIYMLGAMILLVIH